MASNAFLPSLAAAGLSLLLLPTVALPHEVVHDVERGRAIAVRARFEDGASLAGVESEVFSPGDAATPYWKGRTDRNGWLAFVPDRPGTWRVRFVTSTGHGLDTNVDVAAPGVGGEAGGAAPSGIASFAFLLRPVVGVALVAAIFFLVHARGRRNRS
jgi:nickel transport protein